MQKLYYDKCVCDVNLFHKSNFIVIAKRKYHRSHWNWNSTEILVLVLVLVLNAYRWQPLIINASKKAGHVQSECNSFQSRLLFVVVTKTARYFLFHLKLEHCSIDRKQKPTNEKKWKRFSNMRTHAKCSVDHGWVCAKRVKVQIYLITITISRDVCGAPTPWGGMRRGANIKANR